MTRPMLAVAAAAAFALPSGAEAVEVCRYVTTPVGHVHVLSACVSANHGLSHTTVDPTVGLGCRVGPSEDALCTITFIQGARVGRTGVEQGSGDVWVAGMELGPR